MAYVTAGIGYNRLLSALSLDDMAILEPHLKLVEWKFGEVLVAPDATIGHADFPILGIASVISMAAGKACYEVGMYGREGFGPASIVLGQDRTQNQHVVQVAGAAYRIRSCILADVMSKSRGFHDLIMKYVDYFTVQVGNTASSNASQATEERLARWLLMYRDRLDIDTLPLSFETLAMMLGISQLSVSGAMENLAATDAIGVRARTIKITNRAFLEKAAGRSYGAAEAEYRHLIGPF